MKEKGCTWMRAGWECHQMLSTPVDLRSSPFPYDRLHCRRRVTLRVIHVTGCHVVTLQFPYVYLCYILSLGSQKVFVIVASALKGLTVIAAGFSHLFLLSV
ncbi:unnamed protein product [Cercopithifilaria johnstoni]|uniref:Uncharacterized protein n=1 Tax=Cercopithifilaria johnstoni TaxID=2874296 RepID=A0A8J2M8V0_9BILA|nr:unnamed protein product [Cercopithifilaria johnstoni]